MLQVNGSTVHESLIAIYHRAGTLRYWRAVRYCSSLLHHIVDSISPFITTVLVNGKQVNLKRNFSFICLTFGVIIRELCKNFEST